MKDAKCVLIKETRALPLSVYSCVESEVGIHFIELWKPFELSETSFYTFSSSFTASFLMFMLTNVGAI